MGGIVLGAMGVMGVIVLGAMGVIVLRRSDRIGSDGAMVRAPEMAISLQRQPQIASALIRCDPMGREEPIDLS